MSRRTAVLTLAGLIAIGTMCTSICADAAEAAKTGGSQAGVGGDTRQAAPATPQTETAGALEKSDWLVIAAYFTLLLGVALWVIRKGKDTADDYFLAGRNLGWFIVGASIFSSNIGSEHLVGLAGSGCTDGVAMAHYELHAWCLLVLAWVLVPFYARSMVFTMPEFLEKRFSATARWVLSIISLVAYVLTKIAVGIFAGGIVFKTLLPEVQLDLGFMVLNSFWIGSVLVIVLTGIYTVLGGLRAVAYTEALQTIILVVGSVLVTIFGLIKLGGWGELRKAPYEGTTETYNEGFNLWKPLVPKDVEGTWAPLIEKNEYSARLKRPGEFEKVRQLWKDEGEGIRALGGPLKDDPNGGSVEQAINFDKQKWTPAEAQAWLRDREYQWTQFGQGGEVISQAWYFNDNYPWLGMLFCAPIIGLWYWCTDQYIVQRALGAPNERAARRGSICAAFLKLLPVFIFIIPGMICFALASKGYAGLEHLVDEEGKAIGDQCQAAFPLMVKHVLPVGVRGIVVAGLLSALMSSLAGVFNASSTLFTMDLYQKFKPDASQHQLVWTGRAATTTMVLIGLAWVPVIQHARGLYHYLQTVQGYLAPPIFVVFFFGVFMKRLNAKGCLAALIVGFILGLFRLAVDTPVQLIEDFEYAEGSFFWITNKIFFQYYSLLIFIICVLVMIAVSYLTWRGSRG